MKTVLVFFCVVLLSLVAFAALGAYAGGVAIDLGSGCSLPVVCG